MFQPSSKVKSLAHESYVKKFTSSDDGDGKVIKTNKDKQFDATLDLHDDADRLDDAIALMKECLDAICDPDVSKKSKANSSKLAYKTILPALGHMSSHMRSAATQLAPIPAIGYAQKRGATKQKNDARTAALKNNESIEVILLKDFLRKNENNSQRELSGTLVTPPKRTALTRSAKKLPITITAPTPANRNGYTKTEFCEILTQYPKRSKQRANMLKMMYAMKFVTQHPSSLRRYIRTYEAFGPGEGFLDEEMRGPGAPPILDEDELLQSLEEFEDHNGQVMTAGGKMKEILDESKRRKLNAAGYCTFGEHNSVSRQTTVNYLALCAGKEGIHIAESAISKTVARFASEGSFRCVFTTITLALSTQFVEIPEEDPKIRKMAQGLSPNGRLLYNLASDVRGGRPVRPVPARNLVNRDDKVFFAKPGSKESSPPAAMLCTTSSLQKRGHSSLSEVRDEKNITGIRTKVHGCLNGEADSAAQCLTFALNKREMPEDDIIVFQIEGLCIGGQACNNKGYVIFLCKSSPGAELKRFNFIEKYVHLPFVREKCRSQDFPDCPTVSSCDGDLSQIKCITETNMMKVYAEENIICNKHNASNTGAEQELDKSKVFPTVEKEYNNLTEADLPGSDCIMKKRMDDCFSENKHRLRIGTNRRKAITDTVCCWPEVATKAFAKKNGQYGWLVSGHLDPIHKLFAQIDGMAGTCKRKIPKAVFDRFMDNIQLVFDKVQELGYVPEEIWDKIGIPEDVGPDGKVFERNAGISQESQQRAKILNHSFQRQEREKRREEIDEAARQKKLRAENKVKANVAGDAATVQKLLQLLKARDKTAELSLANCTKEDFSSILAPNLRNFIFHRSTDKKHDTKAKLGKILKGSLAEANEEVEGSEDNQLVSIAYELRSAICKLDDADSPDETNDLSSNDAVETTVIRIVMDPTAEWKSPADILSKPEWIESINSVLNSRNTHALLDVNEEVKIRASSLARALFLRFEHHINKRVLVESKRSHPILMWFRKNMPAFAAYMVLFNHVKKNPSSLGVMDCLLTSSMNNFLLLNSNNPGLWGAYLVYDGSEEKHVRSGKCTGRGMDKRWEEHRKNAKSDANASDSKFVDAYPSKHSARASNSSGRCFEDLNLYAAAAFEPTDGAYELFEKDFDSGGLFCWTQAERDLVRSTKIRGGEGHMHKFAAVAAYGFELCYDLAISRRDNLSESPGFEAFGLMHGG